MMLDRYLGALVVPLAIEGGGIVAVPENVEDFREFQDLRIKPHLGDLGMAGSSRADLLIGRRRDMAPGITGNYTDHTLEALKNRFNAPESIRRPTWNIPPRLT